jgi:hypothetical protein
MYTPESMVYHIGGGNFTQELCLENFPEFQEQLLSAV